MATYTDLMGASQAAALKPKKKPAGYAGLLAPATAPTGTLAGLYGADGKLSTPGLLGYLDQKFTETKAANESRFGEAKALADKARTEALGYLEGYGTSAKADVDLALNERLGGIDQDAINRGIYNFTTKDALGTMARESAGRQKAAIDEQANRLRADASTAGYRDLLNVISSRVDEYPDTGGFLSLLQQDKSLTAEREERATERTRLDAERKRLEGQRIVHTKSDPVAGTVTEFYADGTSKTFQVNTGPQQGSYWFGFPR